MLRLIIVGGFCIFANSTLSAKTELTDSQEAEKSVIADGFGEVVSNKKYSGGKAVSLHKGQKLSKEQLHKPQKPALILKFNLPKGGDYIWKLKGFAPNESSNSFYHSLNGGKLYIKGVKSNKNFDISQKIRLSYGAHTIEIYTRENNLVIDKLEISPYIAKHRRRKLTMPNWPAPPIYPPKMHPRVMLNPKYVKLLKQRIATLPAYRKVFENIKHFAHLKRAGKMTKDKMYSSSYSRAVRCQAFLYTLTGSKVDGEQAIKNLLVLLKQARFIKRQDISRKYGELLYTAGIVYDWCYPLLTSADKKAIVAGIMKKAACMEIGWPPVRQSSITSHAGEAQLLRDLLAAGIAVYDTNPKIYDYCARRFFAEMVPAREFFYKSHRHHQGDSYGTYRFSWAVWSAVLFKRMSGKMVFSKNMGKVPYSWIYARLPNGQLLRDGDNYKKGDLWIAPMRHMGIAGLYKDPYVKYESHFEELESFAKQSPLRYMLFNNPDVRPKPHCELPWTKFFPEPLGAMIARTGWQMGPDSPVAIVEMKGAGYQFNNHQHLDAGTFQIYYKGFLASDGGAYSGLKYGTPFDWSYNKRTIAHNGMLAYDPDEQFAKGDNDGGQRQVNNANEPENLKVLLERGYRNGHILSQDFGPNKTRPYYNYLKVDLTKAYNAKKISDYKRTFCFLNFADKNRPGVLIVLDRMTCVKPETKKFWLLQSLFEPQIKDNTITIARTDGGNSGKLVDTVLLPQADNIKLEAIGGPGKENWVFGHNYPIPHHSDLSNGWRTQLSPKKAARTDVFLNVLEIMDAKLSNQPIAQIQTKVLLGVKINSRIVTFPINGQLIDKAFSLPMAESGKEQQVLLTGLKPGNWSIGGKFRVQVKEASGTAFFVLKAAGGIQIIPGELASLPEQKINIAPPVEIIPGPRLLISGKTVPLNSMFKKAKTTWIPAMTVLKAAGAQAKITNGVLTAEYKKRKLKAKQGTHRLFINGRKLYMRMNAPVVDGQLYLPVESIASFLQMRSNLNMPSHCLMLGAYPKARFNYPWYEQVRSNRNDAAFPAINACDGDLKTYWAGRGSNSYINFDLGKILTLNGIRIAWYKGTDRKAIFAVKISENNKKWQTVFDGKASGKTDKFEIYRFAPCKARYVKIIGQGNSSSNYNSILEAEAIPAK